MSRLTRLGTALAVAACSAAMVPGLQAQESAEALIARIDSLTPLYEVARVEAEVATARAEEARRERFRIELDTLQVGPLTIVTLPGQALQAAEIFGRVWEDEYAPFVNRSHALEEATFTFQWSVDPVMIPMQGRHYRSEQKAWRTRGDLEDLIRKSIGRAIADDFQGTQMHDFSGATLRTPVSYDWIYRRLATTASKIARACLAAEPGACWSALGIDLGPEDFLEWYLPEELPGLVERTWRSWRREEAPMFDACVHEGVTEQCEVLLARTATDRYWSMSLTPLRRDERITMIWVALDMGGEAAWDRLVEDPEMTLGDALRYASGATTGELEAAWTAEVLAHRPDTQAGLLTTKWTALFWILLCGALAMRSTRWRLG